MSRNPELCEFVFCRALWEFEIRPTHLRGPVGLPIRLCVAHAAPYVGGKVPANFKKFPYLRLTRAEAAAA